MGTMGIKFIFFFISLILYGSLESSEYQRLDPHGSKSVELKTMVLLKHQECQVCHFQKEKKIELKSNIPRRCILCHGKLPHSGAGEHVGKNLSRVQKNATGEVTCLSCHFSHRAALAEEKRLSDFKELTSYASFLKVKKEKGALPLGLIEKNNFDTAMLRMTCTECHSWK